MNQSGTPADDSSLIADDVRTLHRLGYAQELRRCLNGFSNFAISLSIICILAGGLTSFHIGYCSVGGASIGLGWPLACLFSLCVAATMGQIASAFPTAGGLYHWASILGGRGLGWFTAWFNLAGLITVLAAINVGAYRFAMQAFRPDLSIDPFNQAAAITLITASQALANHLGIRVTRLLTDFSGYLILVVALALTIFFLACSPSLAPGRLVTFSNFSGLPGGEPVWPRTDSIGWLFILGLLLPAYTITGFDASAHAAEETIDAGRNVPRGIVRSVFVSGLFGWIMLAAIVMAIKDPSEVAAQGENAFFAVFFDTVPRRFAPILCGGIVVAQYLCGLATVTAASRMAFAFARDGGLPASGWIRSVSPTFRSPAAAIWTTAAASILFTIYTPVYATITAVSAVFLYISYVLPTAIGFCAYGRWWTTMGPWRLGRWFRPLALVSVGGCVMLIIIGMQPPNEKSAWVVGGALILLLVGWFSTARRRFAGPPHGVSSAQQLESIRIAEIAVHESSVAGAPRER